MNTKKEKNKSKSNEADTPKVENQKNVKIKPKKNEPERSWTTIHNNRLHFINGTNIIENYQMLHIKLI